MTQRAVLICFIGIDGSGKTTQARLLVDWLASRGVESTYVWSRGEVLAIRKIFLFLGRRALGTSAREIARDQESYRAYQARKSTLMENPLIRTVWSAMVQPEHLVQINRDIGRKMRDGCVVVCDRYLWDSTVDLAVLNNKNPAWLLSGMNRLKWKFVPQPTITFFIDIPPEEAIKRKDDIPSFEYVQRRANLYRYLAEHQALTVIDGCGEVATVQREIAAAVKCYLERSGQAWPD